MQVTPNDARLWCSLGDLTLEDAHLHTAWERSGHRSVRAQRSLARSAHRQQKYAEVRCSAGPGCGLLGQGWWAMLRQPEPCACAWCCLLSFGMLLLPSTLCTLKLCLCLLLSLVSRGATLFSNPVPAELCARACCSLQSTGRLRLPSTPCTLRVGSHWATAASKPRTTLGHARSVFSCL